MVRLINVLAVTTSLAIPTGAYLLLVNRRLERRIPLVTGDKLPSSVTRSFNVPGQPKLNYVEAYYADLPASKWARKETETKVEDLARTFWTTLPMRAEWMIMSFLQTIGLLDTSKRVDPKTKDAPPFTKGKALMDGLFVVEKGVERPKDEEILFSYWFDVKGSPLLGGVHGLSCESRDEGKTVRFWFITHLAFQTPSDHLVADEKSRSAEGSKFFGYDPKIIDPSKPQEELFNKPFLAALWMHRLYSRVLVDFTARDIMFRK